MSHDLVTYASALATGFMAGAFFAVMGLPVPAPAGVAGVLGVLGITLGYVGLRSLL